MLKNYLIITFRSLYKNKTFVAINVLGLGVAIAYSIVAYLNFNYNQQFDVEHKNASSIYRINSERIYQDRTRLLGYAPRPMGRLVEENIGDIDQLANYNLSRGNMRINDDLFSTNIGYVDPSFFNIFTFDFLQGAVDLTQNANIYISDDLASKYFGKNDPIGKQLTHVLDSGVRDYIVAGVFKKKPSNSSFMFVNAYTNYDNYYLTYNDEDKEDWKNWNTTFIQVKDKSRLPIIEKQLAQYIVPQNKARDDFQVNRYYLDPLVGMAVRDEKYSVGSDTREGLPSAAAVAPLVMSALLLLLACFNFTNTSIAISGRRLKEIGLRKVMGGHRSQLIIQFLSENIILCFLAMIAGLIMAEFLVPAYSQMWDFVDLELNYVNNLPLFGFLFGLLIIIGLLAGSYPAYYITKFEPAAILKGTQKFGGTTPFTKLLLTFQLTIALITIISSIAFIQNALYQKDFDMGYDEDELITFRFNKANDLENFRNLVGNGPNIDTYASSRHQINQSWIADPVKYETHEEEVDMFFVDEKYLKALKVELIQGRNFELDSETDRRESIIVTENLVSTFGWEDPIGKRITYQDTVQLFVVGVVKNMYIRSLWEPIQPLMFRYADNDSEQFLTISSKQGKLLETNEYLKEQWSELFPDKLYSGNYMNESVAEALLINKNILKMFIFLGLVATILSISGLFTLVSLNIIKRIKEVAVRKVLGASITHIISKLNKQFVIIMVISIVFSSVASYYMVGALMSSIWEYYKELDLLIFILSGFIFLLISTLTVGLKVYGAASMNPVDALRNE